MRLLIIGGTVFLGRHFVEAALGRGHEVTIFTRGEHNPDLFPDVTRLRGDRRSDLSALDGREWDAVLDTCGYFPRDVRATATRLSSQAGNYTFVSTMSVYAHMHSTPELTEDAEVGTTEDVDATEVTAANYGPLKAMCETEALDGFAGRSLIIRPGLIVGPFDPSDRFTYWPVRVAEGGRILAPGQPSENVQFIDVRDLAEWMLRLVEAEEGGVIHATGPVPGVTMGDVLDSCRQVSDTSAGIDWVDAQWLVDQGVAPWTELPLWVPNAPGFSTANVSAAVEAGLTFRPLDETVEATLQWARTRPADYEWRAGMKREREAGLLSQWHREQVQPGN